MSDESTQIISIEIIKTDRIIFNSSDSEEIWDFRITL